MSLLVRRGGKPIKIIQVRLPLTIVHHFCIYVIWSRRCYWVRWGVFRPVPWRPLLIYMGIYALRKGWASWAKASALLDHLDLRSPISDAKASIFDTCIRCQSPGLRYPDLRFLTLNVWVFNIWILDLHLRKALDANALVRFPIPALRRTTLTYFDLEPRNYQKT